MSMIFKADENSTWCPKQMSSCNPASRSPRRSTDPLRPSRPNPIVHKRIIVCCDGTWQDGVSELERSSYTNILRLTRMINHGDERPSMLPAIPQIVFYQSGMGSDKNLYSRYVEGTIGCSLGDKVEEAYAFIAHNYHPGDEVFLFGFSRGAYTARMVAMFIGEIGILDRIDMDHFGGIFLTYQKLGKSESAEESEILRQQLHPWTQETSRGKLRVAQGPGLTQKFTIKCLGVFDTVGSFGLPEELVSRSNEVRTMFGFPDKVLGAHIENAYQALALDETRADFDCAKFEQTAEGKQRGQSLKQCWFPGSHADIGGGYDDHDLSDLTLTWMAAQIEPFLSLDMKYLQSILHPNSAWGTHKFHNPHVGIFFWSRSIRRTVPTVINDVTCETIHASVKEQCLSRSPELQDVLAKHPGLVMPLLPLEEEVRAIWPKLLRVRKPCVDSTIMEQPH